MATTKEIQKLYHRLIGLIEDGYEIDIDDSNLKNYVSYTISKEDGNAKYSDCIIMYNGEEDEENYCPPDDIDVEGILENLESIVLKIDGVFK